MTLKEFKKLPVNMTLTHSMFDITGFVRLEDLKDVIVSSWWNYYQTKKCSGLTVDDFMNADIREDLSESTIKELVDTFTLFYKMDYTIDNKYLKLKQIDFVNGLPYEKMGILRMDLDNRQIDLLVPKEML